MKRSVKFLILLAVALLLAAEHASAIRLSGLIMDQNKQPLPYAIVHVAGTSIGTTSNSEGIYSLDLAAGSYSIMYRMIGFGTVSRNVKIESSPVRLDVILSEESYSLKEVTIAANAEDPAYEIIRKAQKKRKYYLDRVDMYSCNAYVKSTQQLISYPKKIMGQDVEIGEFIDSVTKIFYLSESVSELFYEAPDYYKEKMISSRVSGSPRSYSFNQSTDVLLSFYENPVYISGLTPRGIISPIAGNSLFYYRYKLEGSFLENGVWVNKISVIPKRVNDPVFSGTIYIADNTWNIYSADLFITKNQQMEFVDTFRIRQNFIHVSDDIWMPFSHQFDYNFSVLGFNGGGVVLGIFSGYNLNPVAPADFSSGEVLKVTSEANKKDSTYWEAVRPVPLTETETIDYGRKDSTRMVRESKEYLDSLDRKANKFSASSLFSSYTFRNSYKDISYSIHSPIKNIHFNTVEGWNTEINGNYEKGYGRDDARELLINSSIRYGFSNSHFNGKAGLNYYYKPEKFAELNFEGGTDVTQFNQKEPISALVNSLYSLLAEHNYMKVYEKVFVRAGHSSELFNGFRVRLGADFEDRNSLPNSTDYSFRDVEGREYLSNDPLFPGTDSLRFESHQALAAEINLYFRPGQEFINRPGVKYITGSKYPVFRFKYRKGISGISDVDYDMFQASIDDEIRMGIFGSLKYLIAYGDFLSDKQLFLPDLKHFNGNKTWFSDFRINDFKNLPYYEYSTASSWIEIHAEENFGGFFLNKIPLLRKLKLREIAGVHYLHTDKLENYFEFSAGVEKLGFIRAELFTSLTNGKKGTIGFLIGIKQSISM